MRTALDTNILSALLTGESGALWVAKTLKACEKEGSLVICGAVYCEASANPYVSKGGVDELLTEEGIAVDWHSSRDVWRHAAETFRDYARRRQSSCGGVPRRLLADFIIGAHAALYAERLFTFDTSLFKTYYPGVPLIDLFLSH